MDADVSQIFDAGVPLPPPSPIIPIEQGDGMVEEPACSMIEDIMEPHHPPAPQEEYSHYPPQQWMMPQEPQAPPPPPAVWDPFSTIGSTAWVALGVAFIIGFIIGKMR